MTTTGHTSSLRRGHVDEGGRKGGARTAQAPLLWGERGAGIAAAGRRPACVERERERGEHRRCGEREWVDVVVVGKGRG